ncbi:MAG: LuxR C-terminal-related transcriptional regulator [Ardenticatenaceae bacterium]
MQLCIRTALAREPDIEIVGTAACGDEAVQQCRTLQPDVLLLGLNLPGLSPPEILKLALEQCATMKVLVLTVFEDESTIRQALLTEVAGYLLKNESPATIRQAIRTVTQGGSWFSPGILSGLAGEPIIRVEQDEIPELTPRETQVLRLMVADMTDKEISQSLKIGERTVRHHLRSIYNKLGVNTRVGAAVQAMRLGLVE